jgi:signal transduction histidine kinase
MRDASNLAVHELRGPLTVAAGYASMLLDGSLGPGSETWIKTIGVIADKLAGANQLVDSLLVLAKAEDENRPPLKLDLDLVQIARLAAARAKGRADQLAGTLTLESDAAEVHAIGDPEMVATVVDNLLNNALLYGGTRPTVTIHVGRSPLPLISVSDRGRGIPFESRELIFKRFFRVVDHGPIVGSGLGLFLCRDLARRQGGAVTLDWSELDQGSRFSLRMPESALGSMS